MFHILLKIKISFNLTYRNFLIKLKVVFNYFIFFTLAAVIIISAILVVSLRNIFHSALFLCLCFLGISGIYLTLGAEFLFATQILIYAGGIVVLILFAVMLTEKISGKKYSISRQKSISFLVSSFLFIILTSVIIFTSYPVVEEKLNISSTKIIGEILLTKYFLPFEIASFVLLIAIVGAVIFIREENKNDRDKKDKCRS